MKKASQEGGREQSAVSDAADGTGDWLNNRESTSGVMLGTRASWSGFNRKRIGTVNIDSFKDILTENKKHWDSSWRRKWK